MAAAAFKAALVFKTKMRSWTIPCTVSDVNAAFYVFPSGASDYQLPANEGNVYLADVILSAAGTDTSKADIYVNDTTTGQQILNASNVGTVFNRQFMSSPIPMKAGARVRFTQLT